MNSCKICRGAAERFDVVDLAKTCNSSSVYPRGLAGTPVYYLRCRTCGFIFTDHFDHFSHRDWSEQIYNEEYIEADPEYAEIRPQGNARYLQLFLQGRKHCTVGLDFGGGNGLTARLLTQRGWRFDAYDPFGYNTTTPERVRAYNVTSAFEVFEHLTDPVAAMEQIVSLMSPGNILIIIGTGTSDGQVDDMRRLSWWYAAPRNGHISLYSRKSLGILAAQFGLDFVSPSGGSHFFTRGMSRTTILARFAATASAMRLRGLLRRS